MAVPADWQHLDLHNHSHRSHDAVNRLEDYERAHQAGMFHVLGITDHDRVDGALTLAERATFPVIVGEEITTADGELIGLFLCEQIPRDLPIVETAERIRAQGGLVYLQHPFYHLIRRPLTPRSRERLLDSGLVDIVEVVNGGPFTGHSNAKARGLAERYGLPKAAGSDAHAPVEIGRCLVAAPPGPLEPASLCERLREATIIDRRLSSRHAVATKLRTRTQLALRRLSDTPLD
ncbi:MAG: PHP domain-containing protein [Actinomycetia bacterium]|nr:PHP domain-containing protein [Actinomycetes bacterium]